MNAVVFYRELVGDDAKFEYNFYDHKFATGNLVVRKIFMAMLDSVRERLTHLELEYNDSMLLDTWGKKAADVLRLLGASSSNIRERKSGGVTVSRIFRAPLTEERYRFLYELKDIGMFPHYRLLEGEAERIQFYFQQYLLLRIPYDEAERFLRRLADLSVPYRVAFIPENSQ